VVDKLYHSTFDFVTTIDGTMTPEEFTMDYLTTALAHRRTQIANETRSRPAEKAGSTILRVEH